MEGADEVLLRGLHKSGHNFPVEYSNASSKNILCNIQGGILQMNFKFQ